MTTRIWKIASSAVQTMKKALEADSLAENSFARNGYSLRQASAIGMDGDSSYLLITGTDEFFAARETDLSTDGLEEVKGDDFEKANKGFKSEEETVASGVALFDL